MPLREIVRIDEELCDGCGLCVPACAEGAIAIVDGKARLVGENLCDGMGACLGHCPQGAITIEAAEAAAFDELAVSVHLGTARRGDAVGMPAPAPRPLMGAHQGHAGGCPGSRTMSWNAAREENPDVEGPRPSMLRQWPVQLHLLPPKAPYLRDAELLLAADCVAFAAGDFHRDFLAGRALAIACPKLDSNLEVYIEKLTAMVEVGGVRSIAIAVMEVPCCSGLVRLVQQAVACARRPIPVRMTVIGVHGNVLAEAEVPVGASPSSSPARATLPVR